MIGIYCITNILNNKKYVGKSKHIEKRIKQHIYQLTRDEILKSTTNRHLFNAVKKYGMGVFNFTVLEEFETIDEDIMSERELYFIDTLKTCEREFGYNLRRDSSTTMLCHTETRQLISDSVSGDKNPNFGNRWTPVMRIKMSIMKKQQIEDGSYDWMKSPEYRAKLSARATEMWKDIEKKTVMSRKVALLKSTLRFYEYNKKTGQLLHVWESMQEILDSCPDYHRIAIYSVCNGHKKSYRGSIWRSELKNAGTCSTL